MSDPASARCGFAPDDDFDAKPTGDVVDARWMAAALALARRGLGRTAPNPSVGAIVVAPVGEGIVLGRGWTQPGGRPHAEPVALAQAGEAARGATLYVTLEPCSHFGQTPPCTDAILAAGIARVVVTEGDPDRRVDGQGLAELRAAGVAVTKGVMSAEAAHLNRGHVLRTTLGRPFVSLKLAVSRDGKVALAGGRPVAITSEASRARVHLMRAEGDAILVGIGTVLADDPDLTCRLPGLSDRSPIRVVLDGALRTPVASRLAATARDTPTWIVAARDADAARAEALQTAGVELLDVDRAADGGLRLDQALTTLGSRGITRLMVRGGPQVAASLLAQGLVDEATIVTGPATLGPAALDGLPPDAFGPQAGFVETARAEVGEDLWTTYVRG